MIIKILVVDDSATDRVIISSMLSGYNIILASDGNEAITKINQDPEINLVILDINMPKMNGFQVLEILQNDEKYNHLRVIILTNYEEFENEIKGLKAGAVDYIRKPINIESLKARIDVHVELLKIQNVLEEKLNETSMTFDMIFEHAPIGITVSQNYDLSCIDKAIVSVNPMFMEITGRSKAEFVKLGWEKITHPDDLMEDMENFKKLQSGDIKNYSMEKRYLKPDGSIVWVYMVIAAISPVGDHSFNYICLVQDITKRKETESNLKYIHEHNKLTGLYNREYMEDFLEKDSQVPCPCKKAFISVNLSTLNILTSNFGFLYIQNLVKKSAETLKHYCIEKCILFHPYENQFVFYLKNYRDKEELIEYCDKLGNILEKLFVSEGIGGGLGIIEVECNNKLTIDQIMKKLLVASERSINVFDKDFRACFYDEKLEALVDRDGLIRQELSRLVDNNDNMELYLQYQPIYDLSTDKIYGFEALARLKTEKLGSVSPVEFIPIAEKTKLIIPLGEKIIIYAFHFLKRLKKLGYDDVAISINVSAIQLLRPDFTERLFKIINDMVIDPCNVNIEITESVFVSEYERINNVIKTINNTGIHIAIDDFGTGYSSLAREKELNVDCLKIDKYFIDKLMEEDTDKAITSDIISMVHKLGHYAIAEGVEYKKQMDYLKIHGCDKIQGYLIGRPLDEDAAIEQLSKCFP